MFRVASGYRYLLFYDLGHNDLHYIKNNDPMRDKISHENIYYAEYAVL